MKMNSAEKTIVKQIVNTLRTKDFQLFTSLNPSTPRTNVMKVILKRIVNR